MIPFVLLRLQRGDGGDCYLCVISFSDCNAGETKMGIYGSEVYFRSEANKNVHPKGALISQNYLPWKSQQFHCDVCRASMPDKSVSQAFQSVGCWFA